MLLEFYRVVHTPEFPLAFSLQVIKTKLTGSHLHHFLIHVEHNQEKGKYKHWFMTINLHCLHQTEMVFIWNRHVILELIWLSLLLWRVWKFWSDHHVVLCWLTACITVWGWFEHSREQNWPYLLLAPISHQLWMCAITSLFCMLCLDAICMMLLLVQCCYLWVTFPWHWKQAA